MKISICMAYYNRQALLDKTLESLHQSSVKDYELIIVDDASDVPLVCDEAKIIRVEKQDKWYTCSAVAFNRAFREATGDIIIIQNPECYHVGDVLTYAKQNIKENFYLSFSCYAINKTETQNFLNGQMPEISNYIIGGGSGNGWYNHTTYPVGYHFCSAILRKDLDRIGGFDERYALGSAYDDDDLIRRIKYMGMNIKIIDKPHVIHQFHSHFEFDGNNKWRPLHDRNLAIFKSGYNSTVPMDYGRNTNFFRNDRPEWGIVEDNYKKFYANYNETKVPVIPKKLHMVWLGEELPPKYTRLIDTWKKFHSEWEFKIWNDKDVQEFGMINKVAYDNVDNLGVKSDILRYEILYKYGGLYVDTDFECLKSFDDLLYLDFFAGGRGIGPIVANGLMACKPNNVLMKNAIDMIGAKQSDLDFNINRALKVAGVDFITDLYFKYIKTTTDKTVLFPDSFFYSAPNSFRYDIRNDTLMDRVRVQSYLKPDSYCVHLWYTSWLPSDAPPPLITPPPPHTHEEKFVQPYIPPKPAHAPPKQTSPISRRIDKIKYMKRRYGRRYPR